LHTAYYTEFLSTIERQDRARQTILNKSYSLLRSLLVPGMIYGSGTGATSARRGGDTCASYAAANGVLLDGHTRAILLSTPHLLFLAPLLGVRVVPFHLRGKKGQRARRVQLPTHVRKTIQANTMTHLPLCSPLGVLPAHGLLAPGAHNRERGLLVAQEIARGGAGRTPRRVITLRAERRHDGFLWGRGRLWPGRRWGQSRLASASAPRADAG
jgi:hypothetical protein